MLPRFKYSALTWFFCDLETSFSFWYWEEDTFTNGNFLHQCKCPSQKGNFCSVFTVSPVYFSKKKKKSAKNNLCQKCTFSGDTFYYPSIIFNVCSFEIFVTPTGKKKKKKKKKNSVGSRWQRSMELLSEKHLLTRSLSGGCGRRGSLRRECREHWPGSPNTGLQKPGRPPASHMTLSPSCAHLPSRSLFTSRNCGTTKSHNSSKYSKTNTKKQV